MQRLGAKPPSPWGLRCAGVQHYRSDSGNRLALSPAVQPVPGREPRQDRPGPTRLPNRNLLDHHGPAGCARRSGSGELSAKFEQLARAGWRVRAEPKPCQDCASAGAAHLPLRPSFTLDRNVSRQTGAVLFPAGLRRTCSTWCPCPAGTYAFFLTPVTHVHREGAGADRALPGSRQSDLVGGSYIDLMVWNTPVYHDQDGTLVRKSKHPQRPRPSSRSEGSRAASTRWTVRVKSAQIPALHRSAWHRSALRRRRSPPARGVFRDPITDISAWPCILPRCRSGGATIGKLRCGDNGNPGTPVCSCGVNPTIGLSAASPEPAATSRVVRKLASARHLSAA